MKQFMVSNKTHIFHMKTTHRCQCNIESSRQALSRLRPAGKDMSRSKRKSPVIGMTTARSEKDDKRWHNRVLRRRVREAIHKGNEILPEKDGISTTWNMAKDVKRRFDPRKESNLLRKYGPSRSAI